MAVGFGILDAFPHLRGCFEAFLQAAKFGDLLPVFFDPFFDDVANHRARRIARGRMPEDLLDLGERKSKFLCGRDKLEPAAIVRGIHLVAVQAVLCRVKKADPRVIADGE